MASFSYTAFDDILATAYAALGSLAVLMGRASGMVMVTPFFSRLGMTGIVRTALALVISLPLLDHAYPSLSSMRGVTLTGLLIKEWVLGILLGLALGVPFWAAEAAGEMIDLQRGSTMAQWFEPSAGAQSSVMATLLQILLLALFFTAGGFHILLGAFYQSYAWWPLEEALPRFGPQTPMAMLGLLDRIAHAGALLVGPLAIAVLGADIVLAYLSRMTPRLHLFDLSLPVKNLVFSALLALYAPFLLPSAESSLAHMDDMLETLRRLSLKDT